VTGGQWKQTGRKLVPESVVRVPVWHSADLRDWKEEEEEEKEEE